MTIRRRLTNRFQLTAARRRLDLLPGCRLIRKYVSTHSRPKAAGGVRSHPNRCLPFQLTAARRRLDSTSFVKFRGFMFQLTAARRRLGGLGQSGAGGRDEFQLTAARRRLAKLENALGIIKLVSTHSRPKAAGPA